MEELAKLEEERGNPEVHIASNEMCTFLMLNISSLQLIPVNMIAYRSQYGSVDPAGIITLAIVTVFVSMLIAVVHCKVFYGVYKSKGIEKNIVDASYFRAVIISHKIYHAISRLPRGIS